VLQGAAGVTWRCYQFFLGRGVDDHNAVFGVRVRWRMTMTAVDTTYVSSMLVKTRKLQLICCDYIIAKYVLANLHMSSSECVSSSDNVTAGDAGIGRYGSVMSLIDVDMPSCRRLSPGQPGPGHTRITSCRKRRKAKPTWSHFLSRSLLNRYL